MNTRNLERAAPCILDPASEEYMRCRGMLDPEWVIEMRIKGIPLPLERAAPGIPDPAWVDEMRRQGIPLPTPAFWSRPEPLLPSRVSRRGLPCPEVWDTHEPEDENDMDGFLTVKPKWRRSGQRRSGRSGQRIREF